MILRKPYAFFIKYFRVIHLIMAILMCLLLFQTNSFMNFFNEYINSEVITIGQDLVSRIFMKLTYFYLVLVLIMDVIVWILLEFKNKKRLFYIINFVGYILVLALYIYVNSLLKSMEQQIVDIRLLMTIRDLVIISFCFQTVSSFLVIIRFFGFDIKKFNFEDDLKELSISEGDNEEFEVNLSVDGEKIKRNLNTTFRNFKYYVKENLRIIIPIVVILVLVIGIFVYKNVTGYTTLYKQNVYFNVPNYSLKVVDTFVTNCNYKMQSISDDASLVVLKVSVKTTNNTEQFLFGKFALKIGDSKFYHTISYSADLSDIGNTYIKQKLTNEYTDYLLVYEVPQNMINKKMELVYVNDISTGIFGKATTTKVKLNATSLDVQQTNDNIQLNEEIILNNNIMGINTITFKTLQISEMFQLYYKYCVTSDVECYQFYEPLQASFYGSYDKALLKIEYDITFIDSANKTTAEYITSFGRIEYMINGVTKTFSITKQVSPKRVSSKAYYFEVPKEVLNAETINFVFTTRGHTLLYKVK